jgi:hypothetical protein
LKQLLENFASPQNRQINSHGQSACYEKSSDQKRESQPVCLPELAAIQCFDITMMPDGGKEIDQYAGHNQGNADGE